MTSYKMRIAISIFLSLIVCPLFITSANSSECLASFQVPQIPVIGEVLHDIRPFVTVFKNGTVHRWVPDDIIPASIDPKTGVESKDILIAPERNLSVRIYRPKNADPNHKLPLVLYLHGGGFFILRAFSKEMHDYINSLVASANVIVVSVDYRRPPEHPLPIGYDDSLAALKWVATHNHGCGPESWINDYANLKRVFFLGESAGGNLVHNLAMRVGSEKVPNVKLVGIVLIHPYFWGKELIGNEVACFKNRTIADNMWRSAYPTAEGMDDPAINPAMDPKLYTLVARKALICVAEKDLLRDRNWYYYETLRKSGWRGVANILESKGEMHTFHLLNHTSKNAVAMMKRVVAFLN